MTLCKYYIVISDFFVAECKNRIMSVMNSEILNESHNKVMKLL